MADYLASIFGTEKDKVNCSFYFKVGACRHGERCSKLHNKPTFSQTVLLKNVYLNPVNNSALADKSLADDELTDEKIQKHFDETFEEIFLELERRYGVIDEMNICDNLSEHLAGNCYVKFRYEKDAQKAVDELNNRWFDGRPIYAELSPVTDFHEACCRQYQMGECPRGGFCNFMHLKPISRQMRHALFDEVRARDGSKSSERRPDVDNDDGHRDRRRNYENEDESRHRRRRRGAGGNSRSPSEDRSRRGTRKRSKYD
ncbi:hypothetical protein GJ496_007865 [Pomphorhynchus laevis]|nr:hypothetical protein GJ496_007865 [Pomphorhynchus laevis]